MDSNFPISSNVVSLREVFDNKKTYVIPAYQRPYEWNEDNLESFLQSIIDGFNSDKQVFFGTMQVAQNNLNDDLLDIVDGQQRITTFLLLLNLLNQIPSTYLYLNKIQKNPVNAVWGIENDADYLNNYNIDKYKENADLLSKKLDVYFYNVDNRKEVFDKLSNFVLDSVYVVFLETAREMPLSDVVAVFNTINTTGLDLNAADVFKFRYYDFLNSRDSKNTKEDWMEKINECYLTVERSNSENNSRIEMSWILDVYKHVICAKLKLGFSELSKSNMKFFDDLFDTKIEKYDVSDPILNYDTFKSLVDSFINYYRWIEKTRDNNSYPSNPIELFSRQMIEKTRYSRYWTIPFVAAFYAEITGRAPDKELNYINCLKMCTSFFKYFFIYSVLYAKVINDVQNRVCRLLALFVDNEYSVICNEVESLMWIQWDGKEKSDWEKEGFWKLIKKNLYDNGSRAHLVCTFCALLDEIESHTSSYEISYKLFNWNDQPYDIEHIWARENFANDNRLSDDERDELNGIGNLVVLNRSINRWIKNNPTKRKATQYSSKPKEKYGYKIIENLIRNYNLDLWQNPDLMQVRDREEAEVNKISSFMENKMYT